MTQRPSRRRFLRYGALATSASVAGCLDAVAGRSSAEQVREHEDSLSRFTDVATAVDEGYQTTATYVRTDDGVVGVPFVNPTVQELKPEKPGAILYTLTEDGQYEPLGLKWFVPAEDRDGPPSLFGTEFSGPFESESALIPKHYALHAWLFRENPDGMFARANSAVEPPALLDSIGPVRDRLRDLPSGEEITTEGYTNTEKCISLDGGGYGIPFVRDDADGSGGTDLEEPPVLIYGLTRGWSYRLLGAEWYVPAAEADSPPSLFGQQFHEPMDGHSPKTDQPSHYGLHAWLFRANPRGMFAPLNPTVTC